MGQDPVQDSKTEVNNEDSQVEIEPLTVEFEGNLLAAPDPRAFIEDNATTDLNLARYLTDLLTEKGLLRKDVVRKARLNETYGWEIFSDPSKRPSRDKLLAIAFAMSLSVDQARRLLRHGRVNELYVKNKRDALITVCLQNEATLDDVDKILYEQKLPTIAG